MSNPYNFHSLPYNYAIDKAGLHTLYYNRGESLCWELFNGFVSGEDHIKLVDLLSLRSSSTTA